MIFLLSIIAAYVALGGCAAGTRVGDGYSLAPRNLAETIDARERQKSPLVILDVRSLDQFRAGHAKGATWLDLTSWNKLSRSHDHGFDDRAGWEKRIGDLGIEAEDAILIYDGGEMTEAARVWYILQLFGGKNASVLDGGYPALAAVVNADRIATGDPPTILPKSFVASRPGWLPASEPRPLVGNATKKIVRQSIAGKSAKIVDVRTAAEFEGRDKKNNPRGGHLPEAVNLPHGQLLDAGGRLKSSDELKRVFSTAGLKPGDAIVMHCQSGGRASLAAMAALKAGYTNVANYYMSFGEWSQDETCPLAESLPPAEK